jgi:hypothetical protein
MSFSLRQHGACHYICTPRGHPVFALAERKNETQREDKVPLRKSASEPHHDTCVVFSPCAVKTTYEE